MENAAKSLIDNLNVAFSKENVPVENKYKIIKNINKYEMEEQDKNKSKLPEDFLIDPKTMREIYLLAKNKKLSSNNILNSVKGIFLSIILDNNPLYVIPILYFFRFTSLSLQ